jgi:hypothetical protein
MATTVWALGICIKAGNWNASMIPIGLVFEGLNVERGCALFRMNMDTTTCFTIRCVETIAARLLRLGNFSYGLLFLRLLAEQMP